MIKKKISRGIHDFKELRENNYYYVDKSMLIHELINEQAAKVSIIPRPRRFGKTLNMTMLQYFFEKHPDQPNNRHLFDDLAISTYPNIMAQQGQSPVIFISFKGIKYPTWDACSKEIINVIAHECERHAYLLKDPTIEQSWKDFLRKLMHGQADEVDYAKSLYFLSKILYTAHNQKPIILIDEYDAPMQAGFEFNYYESIKNFMYNFFCASLKDNNYLNFSVITGILRVAKESIFSGMNNTSTYSLLQDAYSDQFGFTQTEVDTMLNYFTITIPRDEIKQWYNGYRVGRPKHDAQGNEFFTTIYNPWAIIECISYNALGHYWINTGGHFLIQETMRNASAEDKELLMSILNGKPVEKTINDAIVFRDVLLDSNAMWSFLVFTGYLTWKTRNDRLGETIAQLILPNYEVASSIKTMIAAWFNPYPASKTHFNRMIQSINEGDVKEFLYNFEQAVIESLSFFDLGDKGENAYQAFALGILASLGTTFETSSNRESGYGRYDITLQPKDQNKMGIVMEFKRRKHTETSSLATYAREALQQIIKNQYDHDMRKRGITTIAQIGLAFQGKLMAWNYNIKHNNTIIQKGSYSAEKTKKRMTKKASPRTTSNPIKKSTSLTKK